MTVKTSKFKSICKNCGVASEFQIYIRLHNISFTLCKECTKLLAKQLGGMTYEPGESQRIL